MNATLFLEAVKDPQQWLGKSVELRRSGDVLWERFIDDLSRALALKNDEQAWAEAAASLSTAKLLYGLSLETALKAQIIQLNPAGLKLNATMDGEGDITEVQLVEVGVNMRKGHGLIQLANEAGAFAGGGHGLFSNKEDSRVFREILGDLEEVVLWEAKYPTPTRSGTGHEKPADLSLGTFGYQVRRWTDPALDSLQGQMWTYGREVSPAETHVRDLIAAGGEAIDHRRMLRLDPAPSKAPPLPTANLANVLLPDGPFSAEMGLILGRLSVESAKLDIDGGEYGRALAYVDQALALNPDSADALILKSEIYRRQYEAAYGVDAKLLFLIAKFDEMVAIVRRAEDLAPDSPAVRDTRLNIWALAVNVGNSIIRDDAADTSVAIRYLQTATELAPDSSQGYYSLGLAYIQIGQATRAVTPLERAAQLEPDDARTAYYYGSALLLADRGSEAVTVLEAAQIKFPDDEDIQTILLNAYTSTGQTEAALERYAMAAQSLADNPIIRYNYGALLLEADRFDEAIVELEASIQLDRKNPDALYNLGAAYQNKAALINARGNETEDVSAANTLFEERDAALELAITPLVRARALASRDPDSSDEPYRDALIRVYTQLGLSSEAIRVEIGEPSESVDAASP